MKKSKVMLVTLSQKFEDGSRRTISEQEICSCPLRGTAELIAYHLRNNDYKKMLEINDDDKLKYLLIINT